MTAAQVSVVIATYNSGRFIDACLDALPAAAAGIDLEVIAVDSASTDDTPARLTARADVLTLLQHENVGFARSNNAGMRVATGATILLLNPDTVAAAGSIRWLYEFIMARPACAVVGPRLTTGEGHLQASAGSLPTVTATLAHAAGFNRLLPRDEAARGRLHTVLGAVMPHSASRLAAHDRPRRCEVVWAAAMMLRAAALAEVGLLDEGSFMYGEENDLCARLGRAGWEVWFEPAAKVLHFGGGAAAYSPLLASYFYRARLRYFARHGRWPQRLGAWPGVAVGLALRPLGAVLAERRLGALWPAARFAAATAAALVSGKGRR